MSTLCMHRKDRSCRTCLVLQHDQSLSCALRAAVDMTVLLVTIDGVRAAVAFEPDLTEHRRRQALGVGAVTATSVLHGLWLLPSRIPVPAAAVPDHKRDRLLRLPAFVTSIDDQLRRTYEPPGVVRALASGGRSARRAVERVARFSPIFYRYAVVNGDRLLPAVMTYAFENGVGLLQTDGEVARLVSAAPKAVCGVPAVYRWWIAELAYEAWLYESTQPVS
jgi:hypothetical protein